MYRFSRKRLIIAGVVVLLLTGLVFMTRASLQTADAETGNAIRNRKAQIDEAFRLAERR